MMQLVDRRIEHFPGKSVLGYLSAGLTLLSYYRCSASAVMLMLTDWNK